MKTATILTLVLAAASLHAKGFLPSPTAEEPRARTGQEMDLGDGKVVVKETPRTTVHVPGMREVPLSTIVLGRDFLESPPGNLVRAELEAANGEND